MVARWILAVVLLVAAFPISAHAASGITPLSPAAGSSVARGKSPTFKLRVRGSGQVWVRVCKSASKNKYGVICNREAFGRAKRGKGGVYTFKPEFHDFSSFWLNRPATYHWQAYRIACSVSDPGTDCLHEGRTVKFNVE